MNVFEAIQKRFSCRAFTNQPVSSEDLTRLLDAARWAGSGSNTQPWRVFVLGPETRQKIAEQFIAADKAGQKPNPDYRYYPKEGFSPYKERRIACGMGLYQAVGIDRADKAKRKTMWHENYRFFGAPVGLIFALDRRLTTGSFLDMGLFLQNLMIAAKGLGLDTCAQAALADYPDILRSILNLSKDWIIVCGMAIGYADKEQPINQYRIAHLEIKEFTTWFP